MYSILCILISIPLTNEYSFNLYKFIEYTYEENIYQFHEFLFILIHKPPMFCVNIRRNFHLIYWFNDIGTSNRNFIDN